MSTTTMETLEKIYKSLGSHQDLGIDKQSIIPLSLEENAWWIKLTSSVGAVEGKLHVPSTKTNRLVIFEPGFPGGGSTDFETHRLESFLKAGYAVVTIRHNGSFLNGLHSDYYISCPERQSKARRDKQEFLGDLAVYTIGNWLLEPLIAIEALAPAFEEIILTGHSFGGLAMFSSINELARRRSPHLQKIKRVVSLAGATGRIRSDNDQILQQWGEYLDTDWARERVAIGDPLVNLVHLRDAYRMIHKSKDNVPKHIQLIFVCPWGDTADSTDEYVAPQEALDMIVTLDRGTIIIDKTQKSDSDTGSLAHDMANFDTKTFLQFVDQNWAPEKQILCLDSTGLH